MTGIHPDLGELGPELRKLAQAVLDGIDPAVRAAAMLAAAGDPGKCQQVWCPVCALAAVVAGEEHPLLTVIADHGVALLALIRAAVSETGGTRGPNPPVPEPPAGRADDGAGAPPRSGYQRIPITVEE